MVMVRVMVRVRGRDMTDIDPGGERADASERVERKTVITDLT